MEPDSPDRLTIPEILRYIEEYFNETVSRQTIYNWMERGRITESGHRTFLRYRKGKLRRFCTREDIHKFWNGEL